MEQMTSGPNFFPKIVKIKGIIPKFLFFKKKNNRKFATVKKNQVLMLSVITLCKIAPSPSVINVKITQNLHMPKAAFAIFQ